jgi:PAS domain S-box-containing protein
VYAKAVRIPERGFRTAPSSQQAPGRTAQFLACTQEFAGGKTRFQTYWEHTAECLFAVRATPDGRFVFEGVNPAHERVSGLSNAMIAGKAPHECLPGEVANKITGHLRDCLKAGKTIQREEVLSLPAGIKRWQTTLSPMRHPGTGKISLILGSAHDIPLFHQASEQAEHGRWLLERIAKACPDFIYLFDVDTKRIDYVSERVRDVLGHPPEHLRALGDGLLPTLIYPDDSARVLQHLEQLRSLPPNVVATIDCRLLAGDRSARWFKTRETVFSRNSDGRVTKILGVAVDIDDLKATQGALCEANRRLRSVLAGVSDGYFALDRDLRITDVNDAAIKWTGRPRTELIGQPGLQIFRNSPLDRDDHRQAIFDGRSDRVEMPSAIHPGRWIEASFHPSNEGVSCFFRDVTERKETNDAIERTKRLLESTINAMSAMVAILDEGGRVVMVNDAWRRFTQAPDGNRFSDVEGSDYTTLGRLCSHRRDAGKLRAGLRSVIDGLRESYRFTYHARGRWFRMTANRYQSDGWRRIVAVHEDVSDLHLALQSVSDLSQKLNNIQEEERQRIACELHDSTSQHLTAVSLSMILLRQQLEHQAVSRPLLDDIERSIDEAQKEIRIFSYLLHPPYLDRDGLKATLVRFIDGFSRRTGVAADAEIESDVDDVSLSLQRSVLRIVQEALTNVHRHAAATRVAVRLRLQQGRLVLCVADNGKGIKASSRENVGRGRSRGVGLPGMQTRVRQFGGRLTVSSGSKGTQICAQVPLSVQ